MTPPATAVLIAVVALIVLTIVGMTILIVGMTILIVVGHAVTAPMVALLLIGQARRETKAAVADVHELVNDQSEQLASATATAIATKNETIAALTPTKATAP